MRVILLILFCGCGPAYVMPPQNSHVSLTKPRAEQKFRHPRRRFGQWSYGTAQVHAEYMVKHHKFSFPPNLMGKYWGVGVSTTPEAALLICAEPPQDYSFIEEGVAKDPTTGLWYACRIYSKY